MRFLKVLYNGFFGLVVSAAAAQNPVLIIDNVDPGFSLDAPAATPWKTGTSAGKFGVDYQFCDVVVPAEATPTQVATWQVPITVSGVYDIAETHSPGSNRSGDAPYTVVSPSRTETVRVNQKVNGGQFNSLGEFYFEVGDTAEIRLGNNAAGNVVIADAVRLTWIAESFHKEYRFFWVSRFQWPNSNEAAAKSNIDNVFQTASNYNFNAVFFQVRGQMDTLYPSPYEPWTNTFGWTNPGWDPLAYALDQAHSRDVELHAYMNTHTLAAPVPPNNTTPQHMYNLHGPDASPGADRWEIHDIFGNPLPITDSYLWLSPGVPEASYHTRRAFMHVVDNYDIDGVHIDRIRTPLPDVSYDPISVSRFEGDGNPNDLNFHDWTADQILRDMRKLYGAIQYSKPHVVVSAAPIGISTRNSETEYQGTGSAAQYNYHQNGWAWLKAHVMDFLVPQIYWEVGSPHPHEKLLADWMTNAGGRWIVPGSRTAKTISGDGPKPLAGLLGEWQQSIDQGAAGKCYWEFNSLAGFPPGESQSYYEALKAGPYKNKVKPPSMPWKTSPSTGFITGYVLDENGEPVVDARVKLAGDDYTYLTAWDGFFSILDVQPAAAHTITATKYGVGSIELPNIVVTAGAVTSRTLNLNPHRGFVEFFRTRYHHEDQVQIHMFDVDLSGSPAVPVYVYSGTDGFGETVLLGAAGGGKFTGQLSLAISPYAAGDGKLRCLPGTTVTAQYLDTNVGSGLAGTAEGKAEILRPADVIVESRLPNGNRSPNSLYQELNGTWFNTPLATSGPVVVKSLASGLSGMGGRYSTSVGASVVFKPQLKVAGHYSIFITVPANGASIGPLSTVEIPVGGPSYQTDLSYDNPAGADNWLLVAEDVLLSPANAAIKVISGADGSASAQMTADSIRVVFQRPVGVQSDVHDWSQYK